MLVNAVSWDHLRIWYHSYGGFRSSLPVMLNSGATVVAVIAVGRLAVQVRATIAAVIAGARLSFIGEIVLCWTNRNDQPVGCLVRPGIDVCVQNEHH